MLPNTCITLLSFRLVILLGKETSMTEEGLPTPFTLWVARRTWHPTRCVRIVQVFRACILRTERSPFIRAYWHSWSLAQYKWHLLVGNRKLREQMRPVVLTGFVRRWSLSVRWEGWAWRCTDRCSSEGGRGAHLFLLVPYFYNEREDLYDVFVNCRNLCHIVFPLRPERSMRCIFQSISFVQRQATG